MRLMRVRIVNGSALVLLLSLAGVAGCGGSSSSNGNGVASKSPQQIVEQSSAAAKSAKSVHVSGAVNSEGSHITLDLDLAAGQGGRGDISENGMHAKIILIGKTVYINGDASFYRHFGGTAGVQLFEGKWLKAPTSNEDIASLSSLANMGNLLDSALKSHGTLKRGSATTVDGQAAITVQDVTEGGYLYVATTGKPYPLQLSKSGAEGGKVTFDRWDEPIELTAPAHSIDISELEAAAKH
jgi:hypothetical protein